MKVLALVFIAGLFVEPSRTNEPVHTVERHWFSETDSIAIDRDGTANACFPTSWERFVCKVDKARDNAREAELHASHTDFEGRFCESNNLWITSMLFDEIAVSREGPVGTYSRERKACGNYQTLSFYCHENRNTKHSWCARRENLAGVMSFCLSRDMKRCL